MGKGLWQSPFIIHFLCFFLPFLIFTLVPNSHTTSSKIHSNKVPGSPVCFNQTLMTYFATITFPAPLRRYQYFHQKNLISVYPHQKIVRISTTNQTLLHLNRATNQNKSTLHIHVNRQAVYTSKITCNDILLNSQKYYYQFQYQQQQQQQCQHQQQQFFTFKSFFFSQKIFFIVSISITQKYFLVYYLQIFTSYLFFLYLFTPPKFGIINMSLEANLYYAALSCVYFTCLHFTPNIANFTCSNSYTV
jgi:hypothetical protein